MIPLKRRVFMIRRTALTLFFLFLCTTASSQSFPKKTFMEKEVQLTIQTVKGGMKVVKKSNPNRIREAVTALNGKEKATQVYLIQRFLADARANVQMTIKIDEDLYELNNTNLRDPDVLFWSITFLDERKTKALSDYLDQM